MARVVTPRSYYNSDFFDRTSSASNLGSTEQNKSWSQHNGTWGITNSKAYCSSGSGTASIDAGTGNFNALEAVINITAQDGGLCFRLTDDANYLAVRFNVTNVVLLKKSGGSTTTLFTTTLSFNTSTDYHIRVFAYEDYIEAFVNGERKVAHTLSPSDFTTFPTNITRVGFRISSASSGNTWDRFRCWNGRGTD